MNFRDTFNYFAFQKVELVVSNKHYLIDNDVDWFDDYFSWPEDIAFLDFKELDANENPFKNWPEVTTEIQLINERIDNILVINDESNIYKNGIYCKHMESSEGIIIVTDFSRYGFFKNDVLAKAEKLGKHCKYAYYQSSGLIPKFDNFCSTELFVEYKRQFIDVLPKW